MPSDPLFPSFISALKAQRVFFHVSFSFPFPYTICHMKRIEENKEEIERQREREGNRNNHPIHTSVLFLFPISNSTMAIKLDGLSTK